MSDPKFIDFLKTYGIREIDPKDQKKTIITSEHHRKHNHFPQGKTGYVPHPCSNPVRL